MIWKTCSLTSPQPCDTSTCLKPGVMGLLTQRHCWSPWGGLELLETPHTPLWFYYQGYAENTQPYSQAQNLHVMPDPCTPCLPNISPKYLMSRTQERPALPLLHSVRSFPGVLGLSGNDNTIHTDTRNVDILCDLLLLILTYFQLSTRSSNSTLLTPLQPHCHVLHPGNRMLDLDYCTIFLTGLLVSSLPSYNFCKYNKVAILGWNLL